MTFEVPVPLFGTGFAAGLWLAFIGWFVRSGASQAYQRLAIDDALAGHTVGELMRPDGPVIRPELPLSVLVHDYLVRSDERALPVVVDGQLRGLISLADVRPIPAAEWSATQAGLRDATRPPQEPLELAWGPIGPQKKPLPASSRASDSKDSASVRPRIHRAPIVSQQRKPRW